MQIPQEVLAVLDRCETMENRLVLPEKLDRSLYTATNKVIELAGGKWDRRAQAHLFQCDAEERIEAIMLTGEVVDTRTELQQFYTPPEVAAMVVDLAGVADMDVLEPSAGLGALALMAHQAGGNVLCVDIDGTNVGMLKRLGFAAVLGNFLHLDPGAGIPLADRIVMNPPFARQADAAHVLHARKFLRNEGRLVSVMSAAVTFRDTPSYRQVRSLAHEIIPLPTGSFKSAGTMVNTCIVVIDA